LLPVNFLALDIAVYIESLNTQVQKEQLGFTLPAYDVVSADLVFTKY